VEELKIDTVIIDNDVINVTQNVEEKLVDIIVLDNSVITVNLNPDEPIKIITEGIQGLPGKAGSQIFSGNGKPLNTLGFVGDWYLDKTDLVFYGPKAKDGWPIVGIALNPSQTYANSAFIYDVNGNLTRINKTDNTFKTFSYDANGNLETVFDGLRTSTFAYDANGLLSTITITTV